VDLDARNSAHISVGSRVLANVKLDGKDVPLRNDFCEELACALEGRGGQNVSSGGMVEYLACLIAMLCMMFPLDTVFLSGKALPEAPTERHLYQRISTIWNSGNLPQLKFLRSVSRESGSAAMAAQLRKRVLIG
jgi:hypothetical protein